MNKTTAHDQNSVRANNMVATSQPLAARAGVEVLRDGGNAVDAALAAAMTLTVTEPTMNGIGGDLFALVWDGGELHALNSSGCSPAAWTPERFAKYDEMPLRGWDAVTVPGQVAGWVELARRFGTRELSALAAPAIDYAENGFLVSPITAALWARAPADLRAVAGFDDAFMGVTSAENFRFPAQARALREICATRGESFYRGAIADAIEAQAIREGGALRRADLESHRAEWISSLEVEYCGYRVHELPPNSQGLTVLIALGILRELRAFEIDPQSVEGTHVVIEAVKLAMADATRYFADPRHLEVGVEKFLEPAYLKRRAALIDPHRAGAPSFGVPVDGGTVLVMAADARGQMVSLIQSNFFGFGSGVVVKDYGISLHNRGKGFTLEPGHPNAVGPRKKPFHTLIPGFVSKDGKPFMAFGLMGGSMQAQGHVQLLNRILAHAWDPQAASDALRWRIKSGREVWFEQGHDEKFLESLRALGHEIEIKSFEQFGGAQIIMRDGVQYVGGSDHRKDGLAAGC